MKYVVSGMFSSIFNREDNVKRTPLTKEEAEILKSINLKTKADKLYSPHLPFVHYDEQWIRLYRSAGYCGSESNVLLVEEKFLEEAMELAQKLDITCEYSGIAGLAMMLQLKDKLPRDKKMLIVNTGKAKYLK
jgi:hypothetical protein